MKYITGTGQVLHKIHSKKKCQGKKCVIHNPSETHMKFWKTHWRADRRLMERICPHGIGHPDPDHPGPLIDFIHGCDGCCLKEHGHVDGLEVGAEWKGTPGDIELPVHDHSAIPTFPVD